MTPVAITYDSESDALSIDFPGAGPGRSVRTEHLDEVRLVDYDAGGELISIELLDVSRGVEIDGLPEPDVVRTALERVAAEQGWPSVVRG
ncbi:MAG: hypothetical protein QOD86_79 [Miltoncostaeaceae bacterium]|jgi:uncharacterized protein YuzE|nr:hypothetical protein [Miltoncostaeaceae bacterium]